MASINSEDSDMEEFILNLENEQTVCMQANQVMFLCVNCSSKQLSHTHLYFCEKCIDSSTHHDHQVIQTDNDNYAERCSCGDSELISQNSYCSCDSTKSSNLVSQTQISAYKAYCLQQFTRIFRALEKATLGSAPDNSNYLSTQMEEFFLQLKIASLKQPSMCASILTSSLPQFQTTHLCSSLIFDPSQKFFMKPCSCSVLENLFRHEQKTDNYIRTIISNTVRYRPFVFQLAKLFSKVSLPLFSDLIGEFKAPPLFQALISQAGFIKNLAKMLKEMLEKFRQSDFEDQLNDQGRIHTLFCFIFTRELEVDERIVLIMCEIISNASPKDFLPISSYHEEILIMTENMNFELISQLLRSLLKNNLSDNNSNKVLDNLIYEYTTKCQFDVAMASPEDKQDLFNKTASKINIYRSPFFQGNVSVLGMLLATSFVLEYEGLPPKTKNTNLGDLETAKERFKEYAMRVSHLSSKGIELLASGIITRLAKDLFEVLRLAQHGDNDKQSVVQSYIDRLWSRDICSIQVLSMLLPGELLVDSIMVAMSQEQTQEEQVMCLKLFDWICNSDVCFVRSIGACFVKDMRFLKELKTSICVQLFYGRDQCPLASLRSRLKQYLNPFTDSYNYRSQLEAPWAILPVVINNQDRTFNSDNSLEDQLHLLATLSTSHVVTLLPMYQSRYAIIDNQYHLELSQESFTYLKEKHLETTLGNMIPGVHRHFLASQLLDSRKLKLFLGKIIQNTSPFDKSFQLSLKVLCDMIQFNQYFQHVVIAPTSSQDNSTHTRAASQPLNFISPEKQNFKKILTSKMSFTSSPLLEQFEEFIGERSPIQTSKKERCYGQTSSKIILTEVGINEQLISKIRNQLNQKNEESLSLQKSFEMFVETVQKFGLISWEEQQKNQEAGKKIQNSSSEQEKQKQLAAERQKAILEQFSSKQKQFQAQNQSSLVKASGKDENIAECAICRTEENILVLRAYVDVDNIINNLNVNDIEDQLDKSLENEQISDDDNDENKYLTLIKEKQLNKHYSISACQHMAHQTCHEQGSSNMQIKRHALNKQVKESQLETFCTICKGLSNIAIPVLDGIIAKPKFFENYGKYLSLTSMDSAEKVKVQTKNENKINNFKERIKLSFLEMQKPNEKLLPNGQVAVLEQVQIVTEELLSILAVIVSGSEEDQLNNILTSELHLFKVINSLLSSLLLQSLMATNMQQFQTKYWKLLENLYLNTKLIFKRQNSSETESWKKIQQKAEKDLQKYINEITSQSYLNKEESKPISFLLGFCRNIFQVAILSGEKQAIKFCMKYLQSVILIQSKSYLQQNDLQLPENYQNLNGESKTIQNLNWLWTTQNPNSLDIQINCLPYFRLVSVFLQLLGTFEQSILVKLTPPNDLDPETELEGLSEAFGKEFITLNVKDLLPKQLNIDNLPSCQLFSFGDKVFELFRLPKTFDEFYRKQFWKKCSIEKSFPRIIESPLIVCIICGKQICSQSDYEGDQIANDLQHVDDKHSGVGAFIQLSDSRVVLVDRMSKQNSNFLYADKFNRPAHCLAHTNWKDYLLDSQVLNEIYQMIIQRRIPQQIRYTLMQIEDDPFYFSDDEDNNDD